MEKWVRYRCSQRGTASSSHASRNEGSSVELCGSTSTGPTIEHLRGCEMKSMVADTVTDRWDQVMTNDQKKKAVK